MNVGVVGLGYIGLPTALLLAHSGHKVIGIDVNKEKIEKLNEGKLPFEEKELDKLFKKAKRYFSVTTDFSAIENCSAVIICVPTPMKNKRMDAKYIIAAVKNTGRNIKKNTLVILESTVTPGTTGKLVKNLLERESRLKAEKDFYLAYCPERAIPGNTIYEMVNNDRIIGGINIKSAERAKKLYSSFVKGKIYLTDSKTAEMVKVSENTYRDVNIALANEMASIAEELGVNIYEVIKLANRHPRVNFLTPGLGVGGHCLPLDPWFLVEVYPKAKLIPTSRKINNNMIKKAVCLANKLKPKKIVILGAAYKANVDDVRESPSLRLYNVLKDKYNVQLVDPTVFPNQDVYNKVKDSDLIIIGAAHKIFRKLSWSRIRKLMRKPNIYDGRHFFMNAPKGFEYWCIGRGDLH